METFRFKCDKCEVVSDLSESNSCLNDNNMFCVSCPECKHMIYIKFNTLPKQLMEQIIRSWKIFLFCKKCNLKNSYSLKDFYYKKNADKIYFKCTISICGKTNRLKTKIPTAVRSTIKGETLVSHYRKHKDRPKPITDDYNKDYKRGFEAGRTASGSHGYNSSYTRGYQAGRRSRSGDFSRGALTGGLVVGAAAGGCSVQ